jgi:predicted transcriptional regulator of viral defense system
MLFEIASEQRGYFTSQQAQSAGYGRDLLTYHTQTGRFIRMQRGLYRLRDYPSSPGEEVMAAWLAVGKDIAVVSHDSALDLFNLSDVTPNTIHLTIPRSKRYLQAPPGVTLHTTVAPVPEDEIVVLDGIRLTSPTRTILDAAEIGVAPEQVEMAIHQAIRRGLTTPKMLRTRATKRSQRVADLVLTAVDRLSN